LRVLLDPEKLLIGLQIRGMDMSDLALAAGLSPATVSSALAGRPVNLRTALAVAAALRTKPVLPEMAGLISTSRSSSTGLEL
jgi:lambda repressor-like predicted transcriptional regulator